MSDADGAVVRALAYKPYGADALTETSVPEDDVIVSQAITPRGMCTFRTTGTSS
jgi:hypothetical protein